MLRSISKELQNAVSGVLKTSEEKIAAEALTPNQKVLDKNKNNKLDKEDFKILRGEKPVKEEVEQVEEKDEGKPGLMFKKIAAKAAKKYGSEEAGNRVAGAIRKKILAKEETVEEAKSDNPMNPFSPNYKSQLDNKEKSAFTSKKVSTGTIYNRKPPKEEKPVKEESNYKYADYMQAAKAFTENDEDAIKVAEAFFADKDESIIVDFQNLNKSE